MFRNGSRTIYTWNRYNKLEELIIEIYVQFQVSEKIGWRVRFLLPDSPKPHPTSWDSFLENVDWSLQTRDQEDIDSCSFVR